MKNMNIQYVICLLVLYFMHSVTTSAQSNVEVTGSVRDARGEALPGANVIVYNEAHTIITFQSSGVDGSFKVRFGSGTGQRIAASFIGYKTLELPLDSLLSGNKQVVFTFSLLDDENLLGEVIVRQENVKQDTLALHLENLNLNNDSKLDEILKKVVGFQLAEDGTILYRGKNIEKIMLNGKETFVHQNSLALQSIQNKMIEEMSVISNHKNTFSLDFDEVEETVLNINTKQEFNDILTGSLLTSYGLRNKFDTQLRGFYFSKNVNAFLSSNNNNIGKSLVELRDLTALFNSQHGLSDFQLNSLATLFNASDNRLKNFQSTSNITLRKENDRFRGDIVLYSVNPNTLSSTITKNATLSNQPLVNSAALTATKASSLFSAINFDFRLSSNKIIRFQSKTNAMWDSGNKNSQNEVFIGNLFSNIYSEYSNTVASSQNDVFYDSKLGKKLLYSASISTYIEHTKVINTILDKEIAISIYGQNLELDNKAILLNTSFSYNLSPRLLPVVGVVLGTSKQGIADNNSLGNAVPRKVTDATLYASATGHYLSDKLLYSANVKINKYLINDTEGFFLPYKVSAEYENSLSRLSFTSERKRTLNPLSSGITITRLYNNIISGKEEFAQAASFSTISKIDYSYTNIFRGKAWGVSLRLENFKNRLSQSLVAVSERGINTFKLFEVSKSYESQFALRGSKTIFKYFYPTKFDADVSYVTNNFPTMLMDAPVDVITRKVEVGAIIETISKSALNFEISNKNSVSITRISATDLRTTSLNNTASILYSKPIFDAKLSFIYNFNIILGQQYRRRTINFQANLRLKRVTLGLEGRNIGDVIGLFNNTAYDTRLLVNDGISSTYIMDKSLNYVITSIKYTL